MRGLRWLSAILGMLSAYPAVANAGIGTTPGTVIRLRPGRLIRPPSQSPITNSVVFSYNGTSSGSYLTSGGTTVMHCTGDDTDGSANLTCRTGGAWSRFGSPSASNSGSPLYSTGFSGSARKYITSFSDSNYYSLGSGSDVLDITDYPIITNSFVMCVVYSIKEADRAADPIPVVDGIGGASGEGWLFEVGRSGSSYLVFGVRNGAESPTGHNTVDGTPEPSSAINLFCGSLAQVGIQGKLNNRSQYSAGITTWQPTPGINYPAYIGRYPTAGLSFAGRLYEFYAATVENDNNTGSVRDNMMRGFLGLTAATGQTVTFTRASIGTYEANSLVFNADTAVPRIESSGVLMEPAHTNEIQRSEEFDNAAWTKTNVSAVTANTVVSPNGETTAESLTSTVNGGYVESTAHAAAAVVYTASAWVQTPSGTQAIAAEVYDSTATSALKTCTPTATTTWTRVTCTLDSAATATNNLTLRIYPGGTGGTGTVRVWGAQLEQQAWAQSYCKSTSSAASCSSDVMSASTTSVFSGTKGSGKLTFTPQWSATGVDADKTLLETTNFSIKYIAASDLVRLDVNGTQADTAGQTFAASSEHTLRWRWNTGAAACVKIDSEAEVCSGGATSDFTPGASFYMGGSSTAGAGIWWKNLRICNQNSASCD